MYKKSLSLLVCALFLSACSSTPSGSEYLEGDCYGNEKSEVVCKNHLPFKLIVNRTFSHEGEPYTLPMTEYNKVLDVTRVDDGWFVRLVFEFANAEEFYRLPFDRNAIRNAHSYQYISTVHIDDTVRTEKHRKPMFYSNSPYSVTFLNFFKKEDVVGKTITIDVNVENIETSQEYNLMEKLGVFSVKRYASATAE